MYICDAGMEVELKLLWLVSKPQPEHPKHIHGSLLYIHGQIKDSTGASYSHVSSAKRTYIQNRPVAGKRRHNTSPIIIKTDIVGNKVIIRACILDSEIPYFLVWHQAPGASCSMLYYPDLVSCPLPFLINFIIYLSPFNFLLCLVTVIGCKLLVL